MSRAELFAQLPHTLSTTHLPALGEAYVGKVRDVYRRGEHLVLVTTDRLSAFDRVLTTVPFKGEVLGRLSQFWFQKTASVVPNHLLDVPHPNVVIARACAPYKVEVVVRGFLTGSLWRDYESGKDPGYGLTFPAGLRKNQRFETPLLTPSTKAPKGEHDAPISEQQLVVQGLANAREWAEVREAALALFAAGQAWSKRQGLVLVDTKYEFGRSGGKLYVIDEIHTPDSSRFWMADTYESHFAQGIEQRMLDKENIRQWLISEKGFSGHGEAPTIPDDVRVDLAQKYLTAYERITGAAMPLRVGSPLAALEAATLRSPVWDR
ncbi:MAG: phosphoribosylaminoimidazolesuccinocarboxamide synthase [Myxococcaceae bacterium]